MGDRTGRARVNKSNPEAFAICDRCGFWYSHPALKWEYVYAGRNLVKTNLLVCEKCHDKPNEVLRARTLPPDPVPIRNPRPGFDYSNPDIFATESGALFQTEDGDFIVKDGD